MQAHRIMTTMDEWDPSIMECEAYGSPASAETTKYILLWNAPGHFQLILRTTPVLQTAFSFRELPSWMQQQLTLRPIVPCMNGWRSLSLVELQRIVGEKMMSTYGPGLSRTCILQTRSPLSMTEALCEAMRSSLLPIPPSTILRYQSLRDTIHSPADVAIRMHADQSEQWMIAKDEKEPMKQWNFGDHTMAREWLTKHQPQTFLSEMIKVYQPRDRLLLLGVSAQNADRMLHIRNDSAHSPDEKDFRKLPPSPAEKLTACCGALLLVRTLGVSQYFCANTNI
jgi:hypothetical protein